MPTKRHPFIQSALVLLLAIPSMRLQAGDQTSPNGAAGWDSTVSRLLFGLGGREDDRAKNIHIQLRHTDWPGCGLDSKNCRLAGEALTFSYEGASGLLELSAGSVLSIQGSGRKSGAVILGLDPDMDPAFCSGRSWHLAVDLSRAYQIDDDILFTVGNRTMVINNPLNLEESHIFSMLVHMPIAYKNLLTITPEFQWSRPLMGLSGGNNVAGAGGGDEKSGHDVFYGGVSVSFSY